MPGGRAAEGFARIPSGPWEQRTTRRAARYDLVGGAQLVGFGLLAAGVTANVLDDADER